MSTKPQTCPLATRNPSFLLFSEELFSDTRLSQQPTGSVHLHIEDWLAGVQRSSRQKKPLKMQNKPNLLSAEMKLNFYLTKDYENIPPAEKCENKPNRTQFQPKNEPNKPNRTQFQPKNEADKPRQSQSYPPPADSKAKKILMHLIEFFALTRYEKRNARYETLGGEKGVGFTGRHFNTFVYIGVLQCEYVVRCGADTAYFYKFNTAVTEQDVLAATVMIDAIKF